MKDTSNKLTGKLAKIKVYTEAEFLALTGADNRAERLLAAIVDDREQRLSDTDFHYLELLKRAWNIAVKELSPHIRQKKIKKLLDVSSQHRVRRVIRDMTDVFGNIDESSKELDRKIFIHKISKLIDKMEKKPFGYSVLPKLYQLLKDVQGLDPTEENIPWDEWELPEPVFSTDINDIPGANADEIEHEEL